ncbi:MAG: hypothetical protein A2138_21760 [Deltaproteobacteria bacterium RBG_16_71_12]|nr:MAG: hypothetical protein A2138_21760 [Deltaproteobacteria bacterium RBG_16_71_12]
MRRLPLLVVVCGASWLAACPPGSLVGQPCAEVGAEVCEGDQLLRCDGQFYRVLAPCAGKCIEGKAEIAHTGDTISADETWTCTDGPHLVEGIVTVADDATLTIEAGALLRLQPASRIATTRAGRVESVGTAEAPILFTSKNGLSGSFGAGAEGGLNIFAVETGEPSVVEHTIIERGIHGMGIFGLSSNADPPVVRDNTLRDNENFGILVTCDEDGAPIPDFDADGNLFFNNGGEVSGCDGT